MVQTHGDVRHLYHLTAEAQEQLLQMITGEENVSVRAIVDEVNKPEYWLY